MTTRRHLALGLLAILLLLGLNVCVYFWGNSERDASLTELRQALTRQILIGSIRQRLSDLQKEIALLGQVYGESGSTRRSPEELERFQSQIAAARRDIAEAQRLSPAAWLGDFPRFFEDLAISWRTAYESLGVDNARAIKELSLRADPLAQMVIGGLLREWEGREKARVEDAGRDLERVEGLVRRTAVSFFAVSAILAILVGYVEWRSLVFTSEELERRVQERTVELQREIEERKRAEAALRDSEQRQRNLSL